MAGVDVLGVFVDVGELAAGFFEDDGGGSDVPGVDSGFPVAIEAATCNVADVEGGGSEAADALAVFDDFADVVHALLAVYVGETGGEE